MHGPAPSPRSFPSLKLGLRRSNTHVGGPTAGGGVRAKVVLGLVAFLALTWVVLMYTPLAHPRDLEVDGATGLSADKIQRAVEDAAQGQSTFRVSEEQLMAAVAGYPEVAAIEIDAHPPFRLDLTVVMRPPVGRVQIGGRTFTVAGDGTVLQRASEAAVPKLDPSLGALTLRDGRLTGDGGALPVLAAAPESFMDLIRAVRRGSAGIEVELQRGPRLIFGSAEAPADKWAAATAVIADGAATRATYIDVRVPGRPAVGGLGGSKTAAEADAPPSLVAAPQASTETAA
ncbi:MAG: FtsQ-type POTRA domain-containing protein, partial [Solirubrobacteraceae bacterium]|nr:FtsQ-type POTRA domain-containing protein [Solirubrobacteraceae bacterium]